MVYTEPDGSILLSGDTYDQLTFAETAKEFLSLGCRGVVLKMGANGTYLSAPETVGILVPALVRLELQSVRQSLSMLAMQGMIRSRAFRCEL